MQADNASTMGTAVDGPAGDCRRRDNERRGLAAEWEVATRWPGNGPFGATKAKRKARTLDTSYDSLFSSSFITLLEKSPSTRPTVCTKVTAENVGSGSVPYDFRLQGANPQQHLPIGQSFNSPGQQSGGYQLGRGQSPGAFSMFALAGALPDYTSSTPSQMSHHDPQRFLTGNPGGASPYSQNTVNTPNFPLHPSQYGSAYQYGQVQQSPQTPSGGPSPIHASYSSGTYFAPQQQQQQYAYYPGHYGQPGQTQSGSYSSYGSGGSQGYGQQAGEMGRPMHSGYGPGSYSSYGSPGPYPRSGSMPGKLL